MDRDSGCIGFTLTVGALLVATVILGVLILSSVGIAPVVTADGLNWDSSAYINHDANRTQRYIAQQENETERSRQGNETLRLFAIVVGIAGVIIVGLVQYNRTRRHRAQVDAMVRLYVAQSYRNARIEQRNGAKVLVDYERHEIVPYAVITQEIDADWRQL